MRDWDFIIQFQKDSFSRLKQVVNETIDTFKTRSYFDKVSLLRFVPHGKGTIDMDLSKEELLAIKKLYLNSKISPSKIKSTSFRDALIFKRIN